MSRKPTPTTASKALVPWDEQLARDAEIAAELERNAGGGSFFSVRGGMLTFNDAPVPNNTMGVIIVDGIFENVCSTSLKSRAAHRGILRDAHVHLFLARCRHCPQ